MDDLDDLIAQLERDLALYRWHRSLIELLDEVERPTTEEPSPPRSTGTSPPSSSRGIDLAEKHLDVKRLVYKFGFEACRRNGWGLDELCSDVFLKLATSNLGPHPYDPTRAKFSTYVVLAIKSVIVNKWRRQTRRGTIAPHVAIDGLEIGQTLGLDTALHAARALDEVEAREPEVFDALLRYEGRMHPTREELRVDYYRVQRVRKEMVAALAG